MKILKKRNKRTETSQNNENKDKPQTSLSSDRITGDPETAAVENNDAINNQNQTDQEPNTSSSMAENLAQNETNEKPSVKSSLGGQQSDHLQTNDSPSTSRIQEDDLAENSSDDEQQGDPNTEDHDDQDGESQGNLSDSGQNDVNPNHESRDDGPQSVIDDQGLSSQANNSNQGSSGSANNSTKRVDGEQEQEVDLFKRPKAHKTDSERVQRPPQNLEKYFTVTFHVHMPTNLSKNYIPVVLGDIPALGVWKEPLVKLHRFGGENIDYWISDPIKIPTSYITGDRNIAYKYAIWCNSRFSLLTKEITFEGYGEKDNRELILKEDFYDIWKSNWDYSLKMLKECYFVKDIYMSLNANNLKDTIIEYQSLRKAHPRAMISATNLNFIAESAMDADSFNQKIFLCLLLGYHIEDHETSKKNHFRLSDNFPSVPLLEGICAIGSDSLPSNTVRLLRPTIAALVRQNSSPNFTGCEWMHLFSVAAEVDPTYDFLNHVQKWEYEMAFLPLKSALKKIVKPVIDKTISMADYLHILKKLFGLTTTIDMFVFIWQDIVRVEVKDWTHYSDLQVQMREHFYKLIASKNAASLYECLNIMPKGFHLLVAEKLRKRMFDLLYSQRNNKWDEKSVEYISKLLSEERLSWTSDDAIQALDIISKSQDLLLLKNFPKFLENVIEYKDKNFWKKTSSICIHWYQQILALICGDNVERQIRGNFVNYIFAYLSVIYPIIAEIDSLVDQLQKTAVKQVEKFTDELVFKATASIGGNSNIKIVECFEQVIKRRLDHAIQNSDEKLKKHIMNICDCTNLNQGLNVPNKLCEEILFYIMTQLQRKIPDLLIGDIIPDNLHIVLLDSSNFWVVILQASGTVKRLHSHVHIRKVVNAIVQLTEMLQKSNINISLLRNVLKYSNQRLLRYLGAVKQSSITEKYLNAIREDCLAYERKLRQLNNFYTHFCSDQRLTDTQHYNNDIEQRRRSLDKTSLGEVLSLDYWTMHEQILEIAEQSDNFINSQTFANFFENCLEKEASDLSVLTIATIIMQNTFTEYDELIKKCNNWKKLKISSASLLWKNTKNVDDELKFLSKCKRLIVTRDFATGIKNLVDVPIWKTVEIFRVDDNKKRLPRLLQDLHDEDKLFGDLSRTFNELTRVYGFIENDCWSLIKELSTAGDFIIFLQSVAEHDLKNLINAVDDHSDERLIQEDTVSSLIQVKQFLLPVMSRTEVTSINAFIDKLTSISKKNPTISKKIALCNAHNLALKNMCNNILSKGEVTKKRIKNAVTIGTYVFWRPEKEDNCAVSLTYHLQAELIEYTLGDLLDLRGRALLIAKSSNSVQLMEIDGEDEDDHEEKYNSDFVHHVDLAQQILSVASKLMQLGHFSYRKFEERAANEEEMLELLENLKDDLNKWETIINQMQEQYYYLTFYPARHILTFFDYFIGNSKDNPENKKNCETLLAYVNKQAKLPPATDYNNFDYKGESHEGILGEIGKILHNIIEGTPKRIRKISAPIELVLSDVVNSGQLFVAACEKDRLENTIMSIFANHGIYPEPWQILICRSSTTAEELSLFTKRCFLAAINGYDEHLFCIANLEVLDFELQYTLVNDIRSLCGKKEQYNLALICCREPGIHHHILDQFREHVHATKGLNVQSMSNIYTEICPEVMCVSSDLSGQGKTEWIRQTSMEKGLIPRSLLVSDGIQFGKLVRQLKESNLHKYESLHLNILSVQHPGEVNMFLFELLTLGMVSNEVDIAELPGTLIFIEVASTVDQYLLNSLPLTGYLSRQHLTWDDNQFISSHELTSPIQVVARYLDAYDHGVLNQTDISINTGPPIRANRCKELIEQYFFGENAENISSYRFIEIFVNVLADQLIRMSTSTYFRVENLQLMVKERDIRSLLMRQFIETGKEFATRSIASKTAQLDNISETDIARLGAILPWEESNHLLVVFLTQLPDSIAAFYSDKTKVPANVEILLKSQQVDNRNSALEDYHMMRPDVLLQKLESLARKTMHKLAFPQYALSADNLLKMALILLRARAHIPVIICGEAGCGKTSLLHFLSIVMEVQFESLNLHAGIREDQIYAFINDATEKAEEGELWLFFDEINTCNHIGILADLIAHRTLNGKLIHHNIRLFAAANPYRLRTKAQSSAGLTAKLRYEEQSKLVYQVHPLPDQLLDYVWDYGILKPNDEYLYIRIMVEKSHESLGPNAVKDGFHDLLFASQNFIREHEEPYSVSLRDVKRAVKLFLFFSDSLKKRPALKNPKSRSRSNYPNTNRYSIMTRSYCLALGLCYQARLCEKKSRQQYRAEICSIFKKKMTEKDFNDILKEEQEDYYYRMVTGPSIAANSALLENILVMIVCILNRIPLFIIAIRLISQNLRGTDSSDPYFQTLPGVYVIPHQGSSSSTSDGILKVFEKAHNYQKTSSQEFPINAVVLLDEVGLAETSPFNPLKVLHSLLEPSYPNDGPTVSVIGISNWRLDNSKSSRALLVQRPKFDKEDLLETSKRLLENKRSNHYHRHYDLLADAYLNYENNQTSSNFHGLRDYYALVKSLSGDLTANSLQQALVRNFGGTEQTLEVCKRYFGQVLNNLDGSLYDYQPIPVDTLISANMDDKDARHLMVIGKSDSIMDILAYQLRQKDLDPVVICGSQFPDDQEDYSYAVLRRIMICVETGRSLILTDLEIIYGSLYDLWNQNYITAGTQEDPKHFTRVALGAYSNPMCFVHENFRCILIMDEKNLKLADPPLLNRFEKQRMSINDTLNDHKRNLVECLLTWVRQISTLVEIEVKNGQMDFSENDMFIGFNTEETVQSLVIDKCQKNPNLNDNKIIMKCKESLISIASSDGIVRSERSALASTNRKEVTHWKTTYFFNQRHDDIYAYFEDLLRVDSTIPTGKENHQVIINTFSNINTDVSSILRNLVSCQIDKLSTFKTEAQLQNRIKHFWLESDSQLLVLQCDVSTVKARCIKLAKFIIEQFRSEYLARDKQPNKHACIILHTQRKSELINSCSFNFMCGWEQITIELLIPQEKALSSLLTGNLVTIIESSYPFKDVLQQELLWCLSCNKYPSTPKSVIHLRYLLQEIPNHPAFLDIIHERVRQYLLEHDSNNWQLQVASNKKSLYLYSSFLAALQSHIREFIRKPIAQILCILERYSVIQTFFEIDGTSKGDDLLAFWFEMFRDKRIVNIDELLEPKPDLFRMPNIQHKLQFPFSLYFFDRINNFKKLYQEEISRLSEEDENLDNDGRLLSHISEDVQNQFARNILTAIPSLRSPLVDQSIKLYYDDFLTILSSEIIGDHTEKLLSYLIKSELSEEETMHSLHLLRICNDLVSTKSIPLGEIRKLIQISQANIDNNEILSIETINLVLGLLDQSGTEELLLTSRQSFLTRCLDIIGSDSPTRERLYAKLFSQKPFPFMESIIFRIFHAEDDEQETLFFNLIRNPKETLRMSRKLQVINNCFKNNNIDSQMAALCVDVIQKRFFGSNEIGDLTLCFHPAIETLLAPNNSEPLQLLSSIAYFKEFVQVFWQSTDSLDNHSSTQEIQFKFMDIDNLIDDINNSLRLQGQLVHSLKVYFLKELRSLGFSIEQLKKFSQVQRNLLPWMTDLSWDNDTNRSRLPINPYWIIDAYVEAENAYEYSYSRLNNTQFDTFFQSMLQNNAVDQRIAMIGLIFARLHSLRIAAQEFNHGEKRIYEFLHNQIQRMHLPAIYKQTIMKLFENRHPLVRLNQQTNNPQLLLISVITHLIAVNASLPPDHSPLSRYMHQLQACQNTFILTCPSNMDSVIVNALNADDKEGTRFTRYQCDCGYKYLVGECGLPMSANHVISSGQSKLDANPITQNLQEDQAGYIVETSNRELYQSVRAMTPASYRILHLFIHVIFGISAVPSVANNFIANVTDPVKHCSDHIVNDWNVLLQLFNCTDETLALLLHAIIFEMTKEPRRNPVALNAAIERDQWERFFTERFVAPFVKSVNGTAVDLRVKIDAVNHGSSIFEKEINETMKIDELYSQEYLPRLWRRIGDTTLDNLRAYFASDVQNAIKLPFLDVFFKYEKKLGLIKHIRPIVKFVQILSKRLGHRVTRKQAQNLTFRDFIEDQALISDESNYLENTFYDFVEAWNSVIEHVTRFRCQDLAQQPTMNDGISVVFGLVEPKGESLYLCAVLNYLISLQNEFLREVVTISPQNCRSLRFLEQDGSNEIESNTSSTHPAQNVRYYLGTMQLENVRPSNIINYKWNDEILKFSQRNLEVGHGEEIEYDLYKMEIELARILAFDKVHIEAIQDNLYLEKFPYHMELFHGSMTLINERNALGDGDMLITDYIQQWMNSSSITKNKELRQIFQAELQLKHIIALYELIEDKVADVMVECIDNKYKSEIPTGVEADILEIAEFESTAQQSNLQLKKQLPAEIFASALKRFMLRYLSDELIQPKLQLSLYLCDESLNCWPSKYTEEILNDIFPDSFLVEHTYEAYQLIKKKLEVEAMKRQMRENKMNAGGARRLHDSGAHGKSKRAKKNRGEFDAM
ncbi:10722_t:CDS:10 [Ambispora gerdemannii]|uniref:10722_t:CDS:1 n=1 Tax=Ambispora gerdemannii TaxID=144530 RepID=A0A9N8V1F6_9GLOM|nr:10722_t:CDS:10 [Ambispora gerdemannii]